MRAFLEAIGEEVWGELCCLFIDLLHEAGLLPERSTFPGDPPHRGVTISHDLMLHEARSRMRCADVTASCYELAPRPCPAKAAGREGCDCADGRCAQVCRRATPLDREARFIHYDGRNKEGDLPSAETSCGRDVYGYASNPNRLIDDRFACAWTLRTDLHPANADERDPFPASYGFLRRRFPWLRISGVGSR